MLKIFPIRAEGSLLKGTPLKASLAAIVVVLGLFAWTISPILAFLALLGVVGLLPIERRVRTSLVLIGCISIGIGAALATVDLPLSQIATLKLLGSPIQAAVSGGL
jgi:predicted cation transporter